MHSARLRKFFARRGNDARPRNDVERTKAARLAPIVFSWLAGRGATATRLDPQSVKSARQLRQHLCALLSDERLFTERLVIYS